MASIAEWEASHARDDPAWDYYQRWLLALERVLADYGLLTPAEIELRTEQILTELQSCKADQ